MVTRIPKSSRAGKTFTRVAVGLGLVGACTVVDKGDYTFTDNPDATGGDAGDGTGGAQGGASGSGANSGTGGTAGEGGEATGGGAGDSGGTAGAGTSGDGGGGAGGDDPCDPNPCEHDSDCTSTGSTFTCDCTAGYRGTTCDEEIDECDPNPCAMNIACTDMLADFSCNCPRELTGKTCNLPRFQPLPALIMDGSSSARAVSADGSVVIGNAQGSITNRVPMAWPGQVPMPPPMQLLIPTHLRNVDVFPQAVSGNGAHWGGEFTGTMGVIDPQPVGGSATMPGMFVLPTGATSGSIQDIDGNATKYVGWFKDMPGATRAASWDATGMPTPLPDLTGNMSSSKAGAITRDGLKVFGVAPHVTAGWGVATWEGDSRNPPPLMLPPDNVIELQVHGVNADGTAVVGSMHPNAATFYAFVSQNSNLVNISPQSSGSTMPTSAVAWDVSDEGKVVVGEAYVGMSPTRTAMRWHIVGPNMVVAQPIAELLRNNGADPMGWQLEVAYGVSADGTTIVGEGTDPMLRRQGFIARIPHP